MNVRKELLRAADAILKSNPEDKAPAVRIRYRGVRPAFNWLKKRDEKDAAALWLVARERLPMEAANDNFADAKDLGVDRRNGGRPRGKNHSPLSIEEYLALPGVKPRLGEVEPGPSATSSWDADSRGMTIKPQRDVFEFHRNCRFGYCAPAIAMGALFLGAEGGLGQPKMGKSRGDIRRLEAPDAANPPEDVETVIEVMLSGGNVADVGIALGARGGYADRRGGKALLAAGKWARMALAA